MIHSVRIKVGKGRNAVSHIPIRNSTSPSIFIGGGIGVIISGKVVVAPILVGTIFVSSVMEAWTVVCLGVVVLEPMYFISVIGSCGIVGNDVFSIS